jgi:hypothetical protein
MPAIIRLRTWKSDSENTEQSIFELHRSDAFHAQIVDAFKLSGYAVEPHRTGLALVIPYPHADLTADGILASAVEHFAPAVLDGSLQVRVDDRILDKSTIDNIAADVAKHIHTEWIRNDTPRYLALLRHVKAAEAVIFDVSPAEKLSGRRDSADAQKTAEGAECWRVCRLRVSFSLGSRKCHKNCQSARNRSAHSGRATSG